MTDNNATEPFEVWISNPKAAVLISDRGGFVASDEVETQSKAVDKVLDVVQGSASEFIDSWQKAFRAVQEVFTADEAKDQSGGFGLESVTVKLSLTASGKVCFVGELGGEVAFEAAFKRR
jgi:hypothetical protein